MAAPPLSAVTVPEILPARWIFVSPRLVLPPGGTLIGSAVAKLDLFFCHSVNIGVVLLQSENSTRSDPLGAATV